MRNLRLALLLGVFVFAFPDENKKYAPESGLVASEVDAESWLHRNGGGAGTKLIETFYDLKSNAKSGLPIQVLNKISPRCRYDKWIGRYVTELGLSLDLTEYTEVSNVIAAGFVCYVLHEPYEGFGSDAEISKVIDEVRGYVKRKCDDVHTEYQKSNYESLHAAMASRANHDLRRASDKTNANCQVPKNDFRPDKVRSGNSAVWKSRGVLEVDYTALEELADYYSGCLPRQEDGVSLFQGIKHKGDIVEEALRDVWGKDFREKDRKERHTVQCIGLALSAIVLIVTICNSDKLISALNASVAPATVSVFIHK